MYFQVLNSFKVTIFLYNAFSVEGLHMSFIARMTYPSTSKSVPLSVLRLHYIIHLEGFMVS